MGRCHHALSFALAAFVSTLPSLGYAQVPPLLGATPNIKPRSYARIRFQISRNHKTGQWNQFRVVSEAQLGFYAAGPSDNLHVDAPILVKTEKGYTLDLSAFNLSLDNVGYKDIKRAIAILDDPEKMEALLHHEKEKKAGPAIAVLLTAQPDTSTTGGHCWIPLKDDSPLTQLFPQLYNAGLAVDLTDPELMSSYRRSGGLLDGWLVPTPSPTRGASAPKP